MKIKTVRLLNERPGWLGLSFWDIAGVGYFLLITHAFFKQFELELVAFVLTGMLFFMLLKIRLRARPKTIRDYLRSRILIKPFSKRKIK